MSDFLRAPNHLQDTVHLPQLLGAAEKTLISNINDRNAQPRQLMSQPADFERCYLTGRDVREGERNVAFFPHPGRPWRIFDTPLDTEVDSNIIRDPDRRILKVANKDKQAAWAVRLPDALQSPREVVAAKVPRIERSCRAGSVERLPGPVFIEVDIDPQVRLPCHALRFFLKPKLLAHENHGAGGDGRCDCSSD